MVALESLIAFGVPQNGPAAVQPTCPRSYFPRRRPHQRCWRHCMQLAEVVCLPNTDTSLSLSCLTPVIAVYSSNVRRKPAQTTVVSLPGTSFLRTEIRLFLQCTSIRPPVQEALAQ
ncbi:hypothetical protein KCU65_g61, partial [Aureobasidium melanogenum]